MSRIPRTTQPAQDADVIRRPLAAALTLAACTALAAPFAPAHGQEEEFPGVELGLVYEAFTPALALKPFVGRFGGAATASQVEGIIARDLTYSDRFIMMDSIPAAMAGGVGIDYTLWDRLGATWLLAGTVEGSGDGYVLLLELHDVPFGEVKETARIPLPEPTDPGFRMAVHRVSDQVVEWVFGEPGMAASRIAFSMRNDDGGKELWVIDSDGENLRRVTPRGGRALNISPAWSPDASRLVYLSDREEPWDFFELNVETGEERKVEIDRPGQLSTPSFHPNGDEIAFSVQGGSRSGLWTYNLTRDCCLENLTEGRRYDLSPTYSPDGRLLAFNSNRLGDAVPQIFVMPADGGEADLISPYTYGRQGYYTSPDWAPTGSLVAFHGRIGRYGRYQILVARLEDRGQRLLQLTSEGNNEDPSWAPDGRHLVFKGERDWGMGLFVVDTATGRVRVILRGVDVTVPEWSPAIPE